MYESYDHDDTFITELNEGLEFRMEVLAFVIHEILIEQPLQYEYSHLYKVLAPFICDLNQIYAACLKDYHDALTNLDAEQKYMVFHTLARQLKKRIHLECKRLNLEIQCSHFQPKTLRNDEKDPEQALQDTEQTILSFMKLIQERCGEDGSHNAK